MMTNRVRAARIVVGVAWITLIGACATPPAERGDSRLVGDTISSIRADLQLAAEQPMPAPAAVRDALLPPIDGPLELGAGAGERETRFDIVVDQAPARAFFVELVKDTPYNVVVHEEVEGSISLDLRDVTVRQVFEVVREVYGFEFDQSDTGYIVLPARLRSKVFSVDYLNVRRTGTSTTRVNSGQVSDARSDNGGTDGGDDESDDK